MERRKRKRKKRRIKTKIRKRRMSKIVKLRKYKKLLENLIWDQKRILKTNKRKIRIGPMSWISMRGNLTMRKSYVDILEGGNLKEKKEILI